MKIVSVLSTKGGSGKTTTATNLAVTGRYDGCRVGLIDLDPQMSAAGWMAQRDTKNIAFMTANAAELRRTIPAAARRGRLDVVLLDTPPTRADATYAALEAADFVVIPLRPFVFDLRATLSTLDLIHRHDKPYLLFINAAPPPRDAVEAPSARETRLALADYRARLFRGQISQRLAISYAAAAGLSVIETEPEGRPALEYNRLWKTVRREIELKDAAA